MKEKIIFFGAGNYVAPIIDVLNRNFDLPLVITTETAENEPVIALCNANNIPYISLDEFSNEAAMKIQQHGAPVAVLAHFGIFLTNQVFNIFPLGILNIHPSYLPKYRGATPAQTTILNGDETTGISIIKLDEQVDHGPILMQIEHPIEKDDTSESLYKKLFTEGAKLLGEVLPKYISGQLQLVEQNHEKATFTQRLTRESGFIDINNPPEQTMLDRMIRAYYPWPAVWFKAILNGREKQVKLLPDKKIQVEGGNIMKLGDFANGYPEGSEILKKLSLAA